MTTIKISAFTDQISDRDFEKLCADNPETKFETTKEGELIVMSPTGSLTGKKNGELFGQIWFWNRQTKLGEVFDSSTGFKLSNSATRSPDVSWIAIERWNSIDPHEQERFAFIAGGALISQSPEIAQAAKIAAENLANVIQPLIFEYNAGLYSAY